MKEYFKNVAEYLWIYPAVVALYMAVTLDWADIMLSNNIDYTAIFVYWVYKAVIACVITETLLLIPYVIERKLKKRNQQ